MNKHTGIRSLCCGGFFAKSRHKKEQARASHNPCMLGMDSRSGICRPAAVLLRQIILSYCVGQKGFYPFWGLERNKRNGCTYVLWMAPCPIEIGTSNQLLTSARFKTSRDNPQNIPVNTAHITKKIPMSTSPNAS